MYNTMLSHSYAVIMAGGTSVPAAYLRMSYDRFLSFLPKENILVVTLSSYAEVLRSILPDIPKENLLLEPYARQTAPCMAFAAYTLLRRDPEAVIIASPSDQIIRDEKLFVSTVTDALAYVQKENVLMTLGIVPKTPDVNFGYIQVKEGKNAYLMDRPLKVKTFTEKPTLALAEVFVRTGEFFWNSGIFIWKAATIIAEMDRYLPEVTELFGGWQTGLDDPAWLERAYAECPKISLDYGVMERTERASLYPAHFGWMDIARL